VEEMLPLKFKKVFALDISPDALAVAKQNKEKYDAQIIELYESDLLSAVFHNPILQGASLFISANLPYIKNEDFENMEDSVIQYEPEIALYGGEKTGFELYEKLIKQIFQLKEIYKMKDIHLFIEIGFDQRKYSQQYLEELGL